MRTSPLELGARRVKGRLRRNRSDEGGIAIALMALLITALLIAAALAVDVGNWYANGNDEQRSADTAALAGSTAMPDIATATALAFDNAVRNGICSGPITPAMISAQQCTGAGNTTMTTATVSGYPSYLRVVVARNLKNFFAGAFGAARQQINRAAIGEFQAPIPMGSPSNTLGDQPQAETSGPSTWSSSAATQGAFWVNVAGKNADKTNGDRYLANNCGGPDLCTTTTPATNSEYDPNGYVFPIRIPKGWPGGYVGIDVFDPAFVNVGDNCGSNLTAMPTPGAGLNSALYAPGQTSVCTGDNGVGGVGMQTTFAFRNQDATPTYLDNQLFTPSSLAGGACQPRTFGSHDGEVGPDLDNTDPQSGLTWRMEFRRWVRLCNTFVPATAVDQDYLLQITSAKVFTAPGCPNTLTGQPDLCDNTNLGGGHNRFAIRAGKVSGAGPTGWPAGSTTDTSSGAASFSNASNISIFAGGRLPIYANSTGADTKFYLARVDQGADGRKLQVDFWDIGDAGGPGDVSLVPPAGSKYRDSSNVMQPFSAFSGCTSKFGDTSTEATNNTCTIHVDNSVAASNGNGRLIRLTAPIPNGYQCVSTPSAQPLTDCWIRVEFAYGTGVNVTDTTTWRASLVGNPVRLVS